MQHNELTFFVDVLLPLPFNQTFTYRVPRNMEADIAFGKRVEVPFGNHHNYAGIIWNIHHDTPQSNSIKYIIDIIDDYPIITIRQKKFWQWLSNYYMCTLGEVMNAAVPSALRLESETLVVINPDYNGDITALTKNEILVVNALARQPELKIADVIRITSLVKVINLINTMRSKNIILIKEELIERFKPRKDKYIRLAEKYTDEDNLQQVFSQLEKKAYKQMQVLMQFITITNSINSNNIKKTDLINSVEKSNAVIQSMIKKNIFEEIEQDVSRLYNTAPNASPDTINLSDEQTSAFEDIANSSKDITLLHGVTSSGKTEIYIKLIEQYIRQGRQVLYLLPEIALTEQIIRRLRNYFGDKVGVYHSKFNEQERVEVWNRTMSNLSDKFDIVIGARSSIFLPFNNLGLIIVDEEHDASYKQYDPAPRYNAKNSAMYLATIHNAKILLGSATPSIESFYNAQQKKYHLVTLNKRYGDAVLPTITIADMRKEKQDKTAHQHFSSLLLNEIERTLKNKEQIILFQNRRGFSLRLQCDKCGYIPYCNSCDVSLTYHKHSNQMKCHYCGMSFEMPVGCPQCQHTHLEMKGFGTEKIEDDLHIFFPEARISRMDYDTTRSKNAYHDIIHDFENRQIDILVGTQMVTKGLDFDNVALVGVLNADNILSFPDFRAFERGFQLMMQVAGRAGRSNKQGNVIIQTFNKNHPILKNIVDNDYANMYEVQIADREEFHYPPFFKLIRVMVKHKDYQAMEEITAELNIVLKQVFGDRVLGPNFPLVAKIQNYHIKEFLIKINSNESYTNAKTTLSKCLYSKKYKNARIVVDVDVM